MSLRELLTVGLVFMALSLAFTVFEEIRNLLGRMIQLLVVGSILYFGSRGTWRWSASWSPAFAGLLLWKGLNAALGGWFAVAASLWVRSLSSENYALIILAPMSMLLALIFAIAGLGSAAVSSCIALRGSRTPTTPRAMVAAGIAIAILNLGQIITQTWIFLRD